MGILEGNEQQATGQATNVVQADPSRPPPSGGGQTSTVGTPQQQQAAPLPASRYNLPQGFYYHPSMGVGTMTGVWGDKRGGGSRRHEGQDIRMPMNTPLVAVTSGTIQWYKNSSAGTVIYLKGDDGNKYSYFHLNTRVAKNGQRVQAGQLIARSGNTGNSSGPHLHFETWIQGKKQDPRAFLAMTRTSAPKGSSTNLPDYYGVNTPDQGEPWDPFNKEGFYDDISDIWGNVTPGGIAEDTTYGAWAEQLNQFQRDLAERGLGEPPRKTQARDMMRRTIQGMSEMVKRDGYTSAFPGTGALTGETQTTGGNTVAREVIE